MGGSDEKTRDEVLALIQNTYVPFLKKLIAHLGKKKDSQPKTFEKLQYVYKTFLEADAKEKFDVYNACKDMLERWYKRYKDTRAQTDKKSSSNDAAVVSEDSQSDASLSGKVESKGQPATKTATTTSASVASGISIVSVVSCSKPSTPTTVSQKSFTARHDGVYFQDEIEIESSDSSTSYSALPENKTEKWNPAINIKKEKDPLPATPQVTTPYSQAKAPPAVPAAAPPQNIPQATAVQPAATDQPKEVTFVCASCQFRTTNETDFMKHARTDHRTDLSLWCKQCGKCFSNAGVLVAHIKESNCQKEDMIYRCGVKDCTFETPSGQTFVHHLRHCHKGSPFIFCIHCQKIFTLPHCLILHMQNECPFKEKNRRNPGSCPPAPTPPPAQPPAQPPRPTATVSPAVQSTPRPQVPVAAAVPKPVTPIVPRTPVSNQASLSAAKKTSSARGRGGRSRGRIQRNKFSDSSDSDDPDDPSWKPEENLNNQPLRRSARWAKKVVDAKDPDLYDSDSSSGKQKKSEQPGKTFFYCPCCDFSALFKSLLEDHYLTDHKNPKRNSCLVCSVKFESKQYFVEHFSIHEKEKAEGKNPTNAPVEKEEPPKLNPPIKNTPPLQNSQHQIPIEIVPQEKTIAHNASDSVKIPYQTAIQEKLQKETKLKSFEDLKSPVDISKMKTETKLQHFFKCAVYGCTFTTDDNVFFVNHIKEHHKDKKLYCAYCLEEFTDAQVIADHTLKDHGKRCYQCSLCFYRGSSKPHVQIHSRHAHGAEKAHVYKSIQHLSTGIDFSNDNEEETDLTTTWPYVCAIGDCSFKTYDPKEFKKHNDMSHRSVTVFFCHYCKVDFISFKRLMSHYHLHGINNYQCTYCVHGSDTREEILIHLCNNHADKPFKVHVRTPQDAASASKKAMCEPSVPKDQVNSSPRAHSENSDDTVTSVSTCIRLTENINKSLSYPSEILSIGKQVFCRLGFCGELLEDVNSYLNHLVDAHCASNILCPYCSFVSDKTSEFESHLMCHGPNLLACVEEKCIYYSHNENDVVIHMANTGHGVENSAPKVIRKTPGSDVSKLINENLLKKQDSRTETFLCPFCYYKCPEQSMMKNHLYVELVYRRFQCNLCKIKCYSRSEAKKHFLSLHSHHNIKCTIEGNADIECIVRNYLLNTVQKYTVKCLKKERENCEEPSGFPATNCKLCPLGFPTVREMHYHLVSCVSRDYQPFICNHCGAKATDLVQMKCHTAEVHPNDRIQFSNFPNKLLEEQHGRRLQELRLAFLKEVVSCIIDKAYLDKPKLSPKYYKCAYCKFIDNFRSNIEKHCLGCHKDKDTNVEKIQESSNCTSTAKVSMEVENTDDTSRDSSEPMDTSGKGHYLCSYCTKKTPTLERLGKHVESNHKTALLPDTGYTYIYCPDPDVEFSADDTELYECAYCSVSQENLYHLKRHCNNLHSEAEFKVRGCKTKDGVMIKCSYCDYKVVKESLLTSHYRFYHAEKIKATDDSCVKKSGSKRKVSSDDTESKPSKLSKTLTETYQCLHCGKESDMMMKITAHSQTAHPDLPVKYKILTKASAVDSKNVTLLCCDFCAFAGDRKLLKEHISLKHKNCVRCGYCKKYLESLAVLELHTISNHRGQRVNVTNVSSDSESSSSDEMSTTSHDDKSSAIPSESKKLEPIDLRSITVNIKNKGSKVDAKLPVVYLAEMFPIFPKVVLHDINKDDKKVE